MKKRKVAVALGLCLAVGLCGASLVACGDDNDGGDKGGVVAGEKSEYYLAGSAKSGIFEQSPLGVWNGNGHASTKDQIPDSIALRTTTTKNVYTITLDLYEGDEFQILIAGDDNNGWGGQMGAEVITPEPTEEDPFGGKPGGGKNSNMYARQDGNYTLTLKVDEKNGNTVTYVRNGNAAPLPTQYNYWVKGETITQGKAMYNGLTTFKTDAGKTEYTITLNLKEDEKISILAAAESAGNSGVVADEVTIADGAAISAIEDENYQYKAGEAGSYTITIVENDEVDTATNAVTTKRTVNASKVAAVEYDFKLKSSADGDAFMNKNEYDFALNEATGKYELTFTVSAAAAAAEEGEGEGPVAAAPDLNKAVVGDTIAIAVVKKGESLIGDNKVQPLYTLNGSFLAPWDKLTPSIDYRTLKILNAGTYTISIEPNSFEVTITEENDPAWAYGVYAHGSYAGAGWADNAVSGVATSEDAETEITLDLKAGDEFGFRTFHASNYGKEGDQINWASANADNNIADKLVGVNEDGSGNFKVLADGKYKFTITVGEDGKITNVTVVEVAA
ncbi:MAG: hypothetical protein K2M48_00100 [Clostridiales bacterium]|nr:hypothetical protein [Clostridiales bacterium]